ncbi:hypothetical protein CAPTEDRAFT_220071 [Capitella teleta]|uniref:Neuroguidin n=1 Tax=Capitella teleta TaxID=283909 RepID=R7T3N5_CAPTE|nr:hypothetical protein CAPTEDRAFT_220071 [Capitella teleta]|eukprot:ELT87333.1 hypothetical protein CAPTEDRAFT_220071 [Capitella teleta]
MEYIHYFNLVPLFLYIILHRSAFYQHRMDALRMLQRKPIITHVTNMAGEIEEAETEKGLSLWHEIKSKAQDLTRQVEFMKKQVHEGDMKTAQGVSFLEVKFQLLLGYITDLTLLMSHKLKGKSIEDHASIDRLVELRTVMEKIRPIDQKLKYQIDKLIKMASSGSAPGANDPLQFKPNPDNLIGKLDDEDDEDVEKEGKSSSAIYRPPKLSAMHYEGDDTQKERKEKQMMKAKKRALSSSIMADIREELDEDRPAEIKEQQDLYRARSDRQEKERTEYEESTFTRMNLTKKQLHQQRQIQTMGSLKSLTHFGNIGVLYGEGGEDGPAKKKKRGAPKKKGKKKMKRKF